MTPWEEMFAPSVPLAELALRGTVVFLALTVMMRIAGQRESGALGITDLMVVVLVAEATNTGLSGNATSIADSLLLVAVILIWSVVLDALSYRWPWFAAVLKSGPRPLIVDGQLNRAVMRREFMTRDEILSQLRLQGIDDIGKVSRAYLEPNGMVSVVPAEGGDKDEGGREEGGKGAPEPPPVL